MGLRGTRMGSGESLTMRNFSLYSLPNIVWAMKFRRLRWVGHVARMEEGRSAFKKFTGTPTRKTFRKA